MRAEPETLAVVHDSLPHDSARLHVTGSATYIDDIPNPPAPCTSRWAFRPRRAGGW